MQRIVSICTLYRCGVKRTVGIRIGSGGT